MDAAEYLYKYIEFFFSKEDLQLIMPPKPLSYSMWLSSVYDMYDTEGDPNVFHYNIKFSPAYKQIIIYADEIKNIRDPINNKEKIDQIKKKIDAEYKNLYYYQDIYIYAHYFFEDMKINNVFTADMTGGGITLEQFKQKIRDKINELYN
jgi:hypothetical protein